MSSPSSSQQTKRNLLPTKVCHFLLVVNRLERWKKEDDKELEGRGLELDALDHVHQQHSSHKRQKVEAPIEEPDLEGTIPPPLAKKEPSVDELSRNAVNSFLEADFEAFSSVLSVLQ